MKIPGRISVQLSEIAYCCWARRSRKGCIFPTIWSLEVHDLCALYILDCLVLVPPRIRGHPGTSKKLPKKSVFFTCCQDRAFQKTGVSHYHGQLGDSCWSATCSRLSWLQQSPCGLPSLERFGGIVAVLRNMTKAKVELNGKRLQSLNCALRWFGILPFRKQ